MHAVPPSRSRGRGSLLLPAARRGSLVEVRILDSGQRSPSAELLDDLVERAGCDWYQVLALLPLMGILIAEGAELLVTSCVAAGLQQEWGLTAAQKGGLSSLAFLGLAVGTLVSGLVADSLGRRIALLASYAGMAVLGAASAKAVGFTSMAACRLLNGAACGVGLPASFVLLSELFPKRHRSTSFAVFGAAKGLGEIYVCCAMLHWMPDLRHGDWRSVTLVSALPAAVFLLGSLLFLRESVHWLSVQGRMVDVRTELLEMARLNGRQSEMESLESAGAGGSRAFDGTESMSTNRWRWEYLKDAPTSKSGKRERDFGTPLRSLATNPHILYKMLVCMFLCTAGNLLSFGMSYFWPQFLQSNPSSIARWGSPAMTLLLLRCFAFLDSAGSLLLLSSSLGLRWIVLLSGACAAAMHCWCWQGVGSPAQNMLISSGLSIASAGMFYTGVLSLTSESFPTEVRGFATGFCITLGHSGSIAAPVLAEALGPRNFLALAALLSTAASLAVLLLPETKGRPLEDFCVSPKSGGDVGGEGDPLAKQDPRLPPGYGYGATAVDAELVTRSGTVLRPPAFSKAADADEAV